MPKQKLSSGLIPPHGPSGDGVTPETRRNPQPESSATQGAYEDAVLYLKSKMNEDMPLMISLRRGISQKEAKVIIRWAARDHQIDLPPEPVSKSTLPERKPAITALPDGDDPEGQDKIAKRILASGDIKENFSAMDEINVAEISDLDDSDNDLAERILRGELGDLTPGDFTAKDE